MDILSDILRTLKLRGTVYFHASFHAPWGMKIPAGEFANFHIVTDGICWLDADDQGPPIEMRQGDVAIFPRGNSHSLMYEPGASTIQAVDLLSKPKPSPNSQGMAFGGGGSATTSLICGHFEYDRDCPHPLFDTLSACIYIRAGDQRNAAWITTASELAASISAGEGNPGTEAVIDRLAEALFIQSLAAHIESMDDRDGFLIAVQDKHIGKALSLMHNDISHEWTISELAKAALMSRSVFTEKFRRMVGEPPMLYLARWRMLKARELLIDTDMVIGHISQTVGYQSEFAFAKAFKKLLGTTPGAMRRAASN